MGQTIGTVQIQKISENEFSCEWHFCKVNFDFTYRSPYFEFKLKEIARCYLEMKPNIIHRVLTFSMHGCKEESGLKISSSAVLVDGKAILCKSNVYEASLDLEPSMKIFEIHLSDPMLSGCFNYVFNLQIKLQSHLTFLPETLNGNISLQSIQNEASITSFNEVSISTTPFDYTTTSSSFNEITTSTKFLESKRGPSTSLNEELISTQNLGYTNRDSSITFSEKLTNAECLNKAREESRSAPNFEYTKELVEDLRCLFTSGNMCDLEIRIGEDVLRAHKLILGARSPVFKKMMEYDCLESSSNSVTITDCPTLPFKKFLKYLYTGEVEDSTVNTMMLLYSLGEKYNVKALPEACSRILLNKFISEPVDDVANIICDVLQLAECHCNVKLQNFSETFIVNNFPVVSQKQNWKDLMKSNFELTSKILALVATGLQKVQS